MSASLVTIERLLARNLRKTTSPTRNIETATSPTRNIETATSPTRSIETATSPTRSIETATSPTRNIETATSPTRSIETATLVPALRDALQRPLADLRLSVTDRCNFRCSYCMPATVPDPDIAEPFRERHLDFEALVRIASAFVDLGVTKVRLTGGEPLVRRELPKLVRQLSSLAIHDLCMTTNGSLLADHAEALASAGLKRVTVSLDAIDELGFKRITRGRSSLKRVLSGIDAARQCGLAPVKINMVVQRGVNDDAVLDMAAWARREGLELRFIEYMDVGCTNGWRQQDVVTAEEIRRQLHAFWPLEPIPGNGASDTAERFRYRDGSGNVAFIASISQPFCTTCSRARVTATGQLYSCLFAASSLDLASVLRTGGDLHDTIRRWWRSRSDRYSELRAQLHTLPRPEMSVIGG